MVFQSVLVWAWGTVAVLVHLLSSSSMPILVAGQSNNGNVKGGYYFPSTLTYVNASLYTHLFYAFAGVDNTSSVVPGDNDGGKMDIFPSTAKAVNPGVLTLISISLTNVEFTAVVSSNETRKAFINSSISLARKFGYDGLDLDWEFAQSQDDMTAFAAFIKQWREGVVAESQQSSRSPLLLTAAVYFASTILYPGKGSYPIAAIEENLDFVNVMTYDFHGTWNVNNTGANANLYDPQGILSADYGITTWLKAGLPADKIVLGLTLYGRSWLLKNQTLSAGLDAPATAAGPAQPISRTPGIFYYSEVVDWIKVNNATVVRDQEEVTAYCYANNVWVTYEDPVIITAKVQYARAKGLRGYFFWAVTFDYNSEVAAAASRALDTALLDGPSPAPSPGQSSGLPGAGPIWLLSVVALLFSILLLGLSSSTYVVAGR